MGIEMINGLPVQPGNVKPTYVHQEYPKSLYKKEKKDLLDKTAKNKEEEEILRADGFKSLHEMIEPESAKPSKLWNK